MSNNNQNHRKFLKSREKNQVQLGEYFPKELFVEELESYKDQANIIFIMGSTCSACDFDPIKQFTTKHSELKYIMFYEGVKDKIESYNFQFPIISVDLYEFNKIFAYNFVPFVLGLNDLNQIIGLGTFYSEKDIENIVYPLLRVYKYEKS
ncbi:hypothetical protein L2089_13825 [Paenibacillus hunanensis]|uniref:hypothetical protein n=1 Tax=Paenibacillus hunanensis TaxID=539262 RepID=UPI002026EB20|nr:hypothetical protein [Paenibacillus hunanensis]MCL9661775.1 hypothetical protein [Paenibacillus hunanensis]